MFENIAELEKEVQEFEQNILASSQLVKSIEQLAEAAEEQMRSFSRNSELLLRKIEQQNAEAKAALHDDMGTLLSDGAIKIQGEAHREIEAVITRLQQTRDEYAELIREMGMRRKVKRRSCTNMEPR